VASPADVAIAVDGFLATPKSIVGANTPLPWAQGYSPNERVVRYPLEMNGELTGAQLMIVGFPEARILKFRLGILFPGNVCRLDFTDETHANTSRLPEDNIPAIVSGPHYHSWRINRRFCRGRSLPLRLYNAESFVSEARTFDAILRWFCADNQVQGLPPGHLIELPRPERLL
jgi:hypothetical protein